MMNVLSFLLLLLSIGLALLGCGYLALSQPKHSKAVSGADANPAFRKLSRLAGWLLIAASFIPCLMRDGWGFGILTWSLVLPGAALIISLLLAYRPECLRGPYELRNIKLVQRR